MNYKRLFKKCLWLNALFVLTSCGQKQNPQSNLAVKKDSILPPVIYTVAKPDVTLLDTCPPPQVIQVPRKPGGSYIIKTKKRADTIQLLPPVTRPADFFVTMQHYNVEEGLALSSLWSSCCDRNGNLWFGTTFGGVSRYDGKSFTNFTMKQGLAGAQGFCAYEDKGGNMWFGTWGGASKYDGKVFKTYDRGLAGGRVNAILQDKKGDFWFGTNGGLSRYNGKSFTNYRTANGLINRYITALLEDKNGNIWIGSDGGVSRYDGKSFVNFTITQGLVNNHVSSMLEDNNGNIWIGSDGGVSMYDGKHFTNFTAAQGLVNNHIASLMKDKNSHIWVGTSGGVSEYDGKVFKNYTVANGLPSNQITSMVEDKNENIWFTTAEDGISRYTGKSFTSFKKNQGLSSDQILSITREKKGNLWFGSEGGGALRYDGKSFTAYTTAQGLVGASVFCIYRAKNGNIWFATGQGVSCYDGKSFTNYTVKQGLPTNVVWSITEDDKGNMWFGTFGGGVTELNADKKMLISYTSPENLTTNNIHCVYGAKNGNIWLGNDYGGAAVYDGKSFKNYNTEQGLADGCVLSIFGDSNGNIWFGTAEGLSRYDGKTFMNFYQGQGLADDQVISVTGDQNGELWAGTRLGFSGLKFKARKNGAGMIKGDNNLSNQALKKDYAPFFENFNFKNGYPVRDVTYNDAMYADAANILWVGTGDKLVRFDHSSIHKNTNPPKVVIQSIKINNEAVCWYDLKKTKGKIDSAITPAYVTEETTLYGEALTGLQRDSVFKKFEQVRFDSIARFYDVPVNLTLPYRDNNLSFEFAAIEPSRPKLVHYQYMLDGYQDNWSEPSDQASAGFGNIHEGSYTFKLKAQSPDGVWSQPILYTFKILPPWYRTWWAFMIYILVFLAALWSFFRWRVKALQKEKILLEQKVTTRTNQLKKEKEKVESTLSELKTTQTQLIQSEKMASLGELTAGIAHEIQNPLNFVNNFSEVNTELIDEMKEDIVNGNLEEALAIADDIKGNQQKINMHGRRADGIVKGMLEHSRSGNGQKEPTNLNALADEYLRLSYHGLRAKDKSFNAEFITHFDPHLPKINVVQQDIGRVLLNLFNNAFYAGNQKQKSGAADYKPEVTVTTYAENGQVIVKVKDNGVGIPDDIKDKIMQPFFTTKPTGQGTGLGLSLSYDMVVKRHGGSIQINSTEGHGSEFIVTLPIS